MFKLLIFDLDGTLMDSNRAIVESINLTFSRLGLGPYDWDDDIVRFFGKPFEVWAEALLKEGGKYSKENMEKVIKDMWDNYDVMGKKYAKLMPGVAETLKYLKGRGILLAVATNMISRHARAYLKHFGVEKYFGKVCAASDVEKGKPHPDQAECIMEGSGLDKKEVLMVGDTETDVDFAKNSGIRIVLLDADWNRDLKSDFRIKEIRELREIV